MTEEFERLYKLAFFSLAIALVVLERMRPFQREKIAIAERWTSNIGLLLIGSVASAIVLPIGIYAFAQQQSPGFLARLELPFAAQFLLTFLFLDFWRYWEHRVFHQVPLLWRLHLVHHSDTHVDVTTSERHHPLELVLSTAILMVVVAALALPAAALGLYLLVATLVSLCSHANLRFPLFLDRPLRRLIVTPRVHAVHHSDLRAQTDSNFGSVLTIWDRFFGTYIDPERARILHFGLAYFHRPQDTGLAKVLQQPFLFRHNLDDPARASGPSDLDAEETTSSPRLALTQETKEALLSGIAGCLLITWVMWPTVLEMMGSWHIEAYQYAWLVLPMLVYLLGWQHDPSSLARNVRPNFTGVFVVVIAAVCWGAATLMNINVGRQFGLILALHGVAISTLGWRSYWGLFPTLSLMFLMIPSGDLLQPALRIMTLNAIDLFATISRLPHKVEGFAIFIGPHRYMVRDECSGLSYVTLATFLGYCFGLLLYRSMFKIVAMAILGAVLGITANVLRVNAIVLIDWMNNSQMDLAAHGTIQWVALLMTLGLMFYVLSRLKVEATPIVSTIPAPEQPHPPRKFGPLVAGLSGLLIAGSAAGLAANQPRAPHGLPSRLFPQNIAGWVLGDRAAVWAVDQQGKTESLRLNYQRHGRDIQVVILETLLPSAKLAESALAPGDMTIWRERPVRKELGCVDSNCVPFLHASWTRDKTEQLLHIYFAYSIGNFTTDSRFALRALHGWYRLMGDRESSRLIGFVSENQALTVDEVAAAFQKIQSVLAQQSLAGNY